MGKSKKPGRSDAVATATSKKMGRTGTARSRSKASATPGLEAAPAAKAPKKAVQYRTIKNPVVIGTISREAARTAVLAVMKEREAAARKASSS